MRCPKQDLSKSFTSLRVGDLDDPHFPGYSCTAKFMLSCSRDGRRSVERPVLEHLCLDSFDELVIYVVASCTTIDHHSHAHAVSVSGFKRCLRF